MPNSCAQFLTDGDSVAPPARVVLSTGPAAANGDAGNQPEFTDQPCTWTLVVRADQAVSAARPTVAEAPVARVAAGQAWSRSGMWFTPARIGSRRYFEAGEIMPSMNSEFGHTIWQWYGDQSD